MEELALIRSVAPADLAPARDVAHRAVQVATKAARANLPTQPDDSQSNLIWNRGRGALFSQPLNPPDGAVSIGVAIAGLTLSIVDGDTDIATFDLRETDETAALSWIDALLAEAGLAAASAIILPYDLPASVDQIDRFEPSGPADGLQALAAWYALADNLLSEFADANDAIEPGPSPVRCWPHHFDIATYVSLEEGDFETARGVGVGMSPGDSSYAEPYFYVNPWPTLDPKTLGPCPEPGHWHTDGFVGAIATATEILNLDDPVNGLRSFLSGAFTSGRTALGA